MSKLVDFPGKKKIVNYQKKERAQEPRQKNKK